LGGCAGRFRGARGLLADRGRRERASLPKQEHVLDLAEQGCQQEVDLAEEEGFVGGFREPDAALPQGPGEVWLRFGLLRDGVHGGVPFLLG
jgi:hypothetical protein